MDVRTLEPAMPNSLVSAAGTVLKRRDALEQGLMGSAIAPDLQAEITKEALDVAEGAVLRRERQDRVHTPDYGTERTLVEDGKEYVIHPSTGEKIDVTAFHEFRIGQNGQGQAWCHLVNHAERPKMMGPDVAVADIFEARELKERGEVFFSKRRAIGQ